MAHSRRCRIPGLVLNLRLRRVGVIGASPPVCIELATKKRRKKSRTDTIVFRTPELCIPDANFIFFTRPYPAARFGSLQDSRLLEQFIGSKTTGVRLY